MTQSNNPNPYEHYSYDHYDQAPRARGTRRPASVDPGIDIQAALARLRSPVFATAALLIVGAAFAGIIIASYPDSQQPQENVPVVQAAMGPFKEVPSEAGGMNVPHRDSTVFGALGDRPMAERPPVENLLDQEQPVDKLAAFSKDVEQILTEDAGISAPDISEAESAAAPVETSADETAKPSEDALASAKKAAGESRVEVKTIISESEKVSPQELMAESEAAKPPQALHAPASSPETIAFVRSVLDKKDTEKVLKAPANGAPAADVAEAQAANIAAAMNDVKPASGTPATGRKPAAVTPGNYFIQLGSVKSRDGAAAEWGKIQKAFSSDLGGLDYRVEEANLGDRGTFYRIQAGPVSKDSASSICDSIKAQKPGACLVVQ